jgi:hypothetical protein
MPDERTIVGDWDRVSLDPAFRARIRDNWNESRRRAQARWTL